MNEMRNFNDKILCFVVGALNGLAYLISGVLVFFYYYSKMRTEGMQRNFGDFREYYLMQAFIMKMFSVVAFVLALLFLKGVYQKRSGLMAPFIYVTTGYIIFAIISIRCIYNADLLREQSIIHAILMHFYYCMGLGLYILFVSPMFVMFRRLRKQKALADLYVDETDRNSRPLYPSLY
ncbi:uncharacterized protein LOC131997972 [Stomoxys calcitrans]|uniref:uncharacterized protein LOC131997972 n=1 Tax=Stomoxys calcitrans TaxID=35570 RepID=UPI0027E35498|nr:uncharacterized protein LOC131997972 [Stomoxys calcitrans]